MDQVLVTLNRTLAVKVGERVVKVQAFTGKFLSGTTRNGTREVSYRINHIHLPEEVVIVPEPGTQAAELFRPEFIRLDFAASAVVATQDVTRRS